MPGSGRSSPKTKGSSRRVGLARVLSKLGYCSRSQAFDRIHQGQVTVNGKVRRDPEFPVNLEGDRIAVQGEPLTEAKKVYLVLNKPRGLVTTAADEKGRNTVYSLLPVGLPWIAPVGRLDKASEGLLLLTNDSEWAARITDPASHLDKTYHVQIDTHPDETLVRKLTSGISSDGELLRARSAKVVRTGEKHCWLEIVLDEGRNRQIRRMLKALDIEVLQLIRTAIGPLRLGDLSKRSCRLLSANEKQALDRALSVQQPFGCFPRGIELSRLSSHEPEEEQGCLYDPRRRR